MVAKATSQWHVFTMVSRAAQMGRTVGPQRGSDGGCKRVWFLGDPRKAKGPMVQGLAGPIVNPQAIVMLSVCTRLESAV